MNHQCELCGTLIKKTDFGWVHLHPIEPDDPRICYWEPVYARPVQA